MDLSGKKKIVKFNDVQTLKFVELYETEECLWNITLDSYKNKDARDAAINRIVSELNMRDVGPDEVLQKINSLRSAFKQEWRKVNDSKKTGAAAEDVYVPRLSWFEAANRFLPKVLRKRKSFTNLKSNASHELEITDDPYEGPSTSYEAPPPAKKVKPPQHIEKAMEKLEEISARAMEQREPIDEFTHFGRNVASQLRALPLSDSLPLQTEILHLIAERRLRRENVNIAESNEDILQEAMSSLYD